MGYSNGRATAVVMNNAIRQGSMKRGNVTALSERVKDTDITGIHSNGDGVVPRITEINSIDVNDQCVIHNVQAISEQIERI